MRNLPTPFAPIPPCRAHWLLQEPVVPQATSTLVETPASPLFLPLKGREFKLLPLQGGGWEGDGLKHHFIKKTLFLLFTLCLSALALAAPKKITAVYDVTRKGQPFGTVNESFVQDGSRYRIESITSGIGVYALLGKRKLTSEGEVTADGLRPTHFEQQQGEKKGASADFDWSSNTLTMTNKGKASTASLEANTQDLASYAYQFMYQPPAGEEVTQAVTSGKKLRTYKYKITSQTESLHLVNVNKGENGEEKELWLATDKHFIPARIIMFDENGARIEQVLTSLTIE